MGLERGFWLALLVCLVLASGCAAPTAHGAGVAGIRPVGGRRAALAAQASGTAAPLMAPSPTETLPVTATPRPTATAAPSVTPAVAPTETATAAPAPPAPTQSAPTQSASTPTTGPVLGASPDPTGVPAATAASQPAPPPASDGSARKLRVPILMYHYVSQPPAGADIFRNDLSVTPERFESHLVYLRDHGYTTISLDDLLAALAQGKALPEKPVVLTFDDGYEDNYSNAFPLLRKYGMTGHFFVLTDFVNEGRAGYMTWPQIEEMAAAGQYIGSHGRNHDRQLIGQSKDYLIWQALGSREALQEHLGQAPHWVAYPSGGYDDLAIAVFRSAGFWGGLSTETGATHTLDSIFHLTRLRMRGRYAPEDLERLLQADW